jgi:hypothetical protein
MWRQWLVIHDPSQKWSAPYGTKLSKQWDPWYCNQHMRSVIEGQQACSCLLSPVSHPFCTCLQCMHSHLVSLILVRYFDPIHMGRAYQVWMILTCFLTASPKTARSSPEKSSTFRESNLSCAPSTAQGTEAFYSTVPRPSSTTHH